MSIEINFSPSLGLSRIRVPKATVLEAGWPSEDQAFQAVGLLTYPGELLCSAAVTIQSDPAHPFHEVLEVRNSTPLVNGWSQRESPGRHFAFAFRVFDFEAKWTSETRSQLDLSVGAHVARLCGWPNPERNDPLYLTVRGTVLALLSSERMNHLLKEPLTP
jgi:hypothetical protein